MYCCPALAFPEELSELKRTHPSIVRFVGRSSVASGMETYALVPSKVKALPTKPGAEAVAPPASEPLSPPAMSLALPSAGHQPTNPAGADARQLPGTVTVKVATALVTPPAWFVTTT